MFPSSKWPARVAVIMACGVTIAFACGPFFGIEVLRNRQQVVLAPASISFEAELKALTPAPKDKLPVVEDGPARGPVEAGELAPAVLAGVVAMRSQRDGAAAYAAGVGLPPAIQLYTAGAVDFSLGNENGARSYFARIVDLPEAERRSREVWARFMLGRIALQQQDQAAAAAQFEAVRRLVRSGEPDPLGLAVASYGEQARGAWRQGAVTDAVALYAQQASYGSESGEMSLVLLANQILNDPHLLDQAIADSLTRRLLFICLNEHAGASLLARNMDGVSAKVDRLVAALEAHGLTHVAGAGLLASAAYAHGRFDVAQKLAALEDVPISDWIEAKLALRRGDREMALTDYQKALRSFEPSLGDPTSLRAEYAVLRVSRGDYLEALDLFRQADAKGWDPNWEYGNFDDYWGDAAYLAERVLTIDELRNYLDGKPRSGANSGVDKFPDTSRLRSILARRLMRAGRRREAVGYFDDPKVRKEAEQYNQALNEANRPWYVPLARAEAWFTAAKLARESGLQLLGFEKEPDYAIWNGNFEWRDFESPAPAKPSQPEESYKSEDEKKRVEASKPERNVRFQYRLTAVDEAMRSADFLPPRSQPFAAVLCDATNWVIDRQPERAEQVYGRYLRQGAHVTWGREFGRSCPQPDFAEASFGTAVSRWLFHLRRHAHAHPVDATLLAVLVGAALITFALYVRTRRGRHVPPERSTVSGGQT